MKFLKNRRAWRIWANKEVPLGDPPREFPCYAIATKDVPYYLYKSELNEMVMKLALNAMASPM